MSNLRAEAAEWKPTFGGGGGMGNDFALPPSTAPAHEEPKPGSVTTSPALQPASAPSGSMENTPPQTAQQAENEEGGSSNPVPQWGEYEMDPAAYGFQDESVVDDFPGGQDYQQQQQQQQQYGGYFGAGQQQPMMGGGGGGGNLPSMFRNSANLGNILDDIVHVPPQMFEAIPLEKINELQIQQIEAQIAEEAEKGITFDSETRTVIHTGTGANQDPSQQERGIHKQHKEYLEALMNPRKKDNTSGGGGGKASGSAAKSGPAAKLTAENLPSLPGTEPSSTGPASVAASTKPKSVAPSNAPLTVNGNHRYKKVNTKAKKRLEQAQQSASDAFTYALLQSVSPFMVPLREKCGTSLPHIKVDQRFGKRGVPQSAVAQFIIAPMVVNYKPTHFHEVTPGDLMEYHFDLSLVLEQMTTASTLCINYGPEWKPFALPFMYLSCGDYKREVKALCPDETPNSKGEAVYSNDTVKDISELLFSIEELENLKKMSFMRATRKRMNLQPLYDVFDAMFAPVGNYQIQVRNIHSTPSTYLLRTSADELDRQIEKYGPILISGDDKLWNELPETGNTFSTNAPSASAPSTSVAPNADHLSAADPAPKDAQPTHDDKTVDGRDGANEDDCDPEADAIFKRNLILSGCCVALTGVAVLLLLKKK